MNPVSPDISLRALTDDDADKMSALLNHAFRASPYSGAYTPERTHNHLLQDIPITVVPMAWHSYTLIGAWRAGELVGLIDAATGIPPTEQQTVNPSENATLPVVADNDSLAGLLRMLILPAREDLLDTVAQNLFQQAEIFWRDAGVTQVFAFRLGTGYPLFQAGAGVLPGAWSEHFRLLTTNGYQLEQRHRALVRSADEFVEEVYPTASISLVSQAMSDGWEIILYHRRIQRIAYMRIFSDYLIPNILTPNAQPSPEPNLTDAQSIHSEGIPIAAIVQLHVSSEWRGNDLGKLLVRRALNDANHRGIREVLVYLSQNQYVAWSLLTKQGFQELGYNGYSFVKLL